MMQTNQLPEPIAVGGFATPLTSIVRRKEI